MTKAAQATKAFGVEPGYAPYRLRQARYQALAESVAQFAARRPLDQPVKLLDVGVGAGVSKRYIEPYVEAGRIEYHGVDIFPRGRKFVYEHQEWNLIQQDLEQGLPALPSDTYDIVVCEQVIEHLHNVDVVAAELARVLKPHGLSLIGVPIFPDGAHLVRKHCVPVLDRLLGLRRKKPRGHVQAFSKRSFLKLLRRAGGFHVQQTRGFRIISGGPLRPLEYCRWWWQANRWLGARVPSLCIEIQVMATKTEPSELRDSADEPPNADEPLIFRIEDYQPSGLRRRDAA